MFDLIMLPIKVAVGGVLWVILIAACAWASGKVWVWMEERRAKQEEVTRCEKWR